MPSLIERRGMTVRRLRFNELHIGKSYLEADTTAGPFVKADTNHRWTTTARNSLTPVSTGTRVIDLTEPGMFPLPFVNHNLFPDSNPSQGARYDGLDPILGPPFAPVFYQLFIDLPSSFASTGGSGGPAHLYWTIPSLVVQLVKGPQILDVKWRVWFALTNDITQASYIDAGLLALKYIHTSNYVWAVPWVDSNTPPATPVGAGELIGTGTGSTGINFNGFINLIVLPTPHITYTGSGTSNVISHLELRRSRGTPTFTDATNLVIPNQITVGTTTSFGFNTPPVNGNIDDGSGSLRVADSSLLSSNQLVIITTAGLYRVNYAIDATHVSITSVAGSNNVAVGTTITAGQRVAPVQTADDYSDRDANTHYFYQLRAYLSPGIVAYFPFNNVGLIHPYVLTVTGMTDVFPYNINPVDPHKYQQLSWTAPTAAEVAAWPTTAP